MIVQLWGEAIFCWVEMLVSGIYDVFTSFLSMKRVTFSLQEADHLALRLLAIKEQTTLIGIVTEALRKHLEEKGAYRLSVTDEGKKH